MSEPTPMAVDCLHLTYRYGQFTAVDDLTLQVRPGETMGLLGPNGAGKTTVVRMLTTLAPVLQVNCISSAWTPVTTPPIFDAISAMFRNNFRLSQR
jgi:ABC-type branched-subunit amino acid transport system ATPase component